MQNDNIFDNYKRIAIVGSPGSGKSTFARILQKYSNLPIFYLDKEHWNPGWKMKTIKEQSERQIEICSTNSWIIDGNFVSTMEIRFSMADLIIFIDVNRYICLLSAIKRRGKIRPDLPEFLNEKDLNFKDTFRFYKFIWDYPKNGRKYVLNLHKKYNSKAFLHLKTRRKVKRFLNRWI